MKKPTPKPTRPNVPDAPSMVSHPPHYTGKVECIDAIDEVTSNLTGTNGYYTGTILKYVWRWYRKNGVEDLHKAKWYLERLIEKLEGEPSNGTR